MFPTISPLRPFTQGPLCQENGRGADTDDRKGKPANINTQFRNICPWTSNPVNMCYSYEPLALFDIWHSS